jgi:crotonobetainyl-CoA:carnitine CoA-transferase CaiB-like acyl-CoA transferase
MAFYAPWTRNHTLEEIYRPFQDRGVVCGRVFGPADLTSHEQLVANDFFRILDDERLGPVHIAGAAAHLTRAPRRSLVAAPTRARLHGPEVRAPRRPLEGLRVLDLTQAWQGPFASLLLADLGANVTKVESHERPDVWRLIGTADEPGSPFHAWNRSFYFNSSNHNKRSLTLALDLPEGRDLFLRLARNADVVMENYTPRVMEQLGLGTEALWSANPRMVISSFCGYGKRGPLRNYKANGAVIEAEAGWAAIQAYQDGVPMVMGFYPADPLSGLQMAGATLAAMYDSLKYDTGWAIDGSMLAAAVGYIGDEVIAARSENPPPPGNRVRGAAPCGVFPCRGEDRWIAISVTDDSAWRALLAIATDARLHSPRYKDAAGRLADEDRLEELLAAWTAAWEAEELMFQEEGVPSAVVRTPHEILADPQSIDEGWLIPVEAPHLGRRLLNASPWQSSSWPPMPAAPPPMLGEHSREILANDLQLPPSEIDRLFEEGVTRPVI